jgi:hypothetical protein
MKFVLLVTCHLSLITLSESHFRIAEADDIAVLDVARFAVCEAATVDESSVG